MSLSKEFHSLRQQLDVLFEKLVRERSPQETDTELLLKAQLPGLEPSALEIQVSENAVFLSGEYRDCHQQDKQGILRTEFHYGRFKRVVPLPIPIHRERVTAAMAGGLLTLAMPKAIPIVPNLVKVPLAISDRDLAVATTVPAPLDRIVTQS
jgi:HSP20 family protein